LVVNPLEFNQMGDRRMHGTLILSQGRSGPHGKGGVRGS